MKPIYLFLSIGISILLSSSRCDAFMRKVVGDKLDEKDRSAVNLNFQELEQRLSNKRDSRQDIGSSSNPVDMIYASSITVNGNQLTYVPWTSYTPTLSAAWGTATGIIMHYRVVGDEMQIRGSFVCGTVGAGAGTITLPDGYVIDESKDGGVRKTPYGNAYVLGTTLGQIDAGRTTVLCQFGTGVTGILTMSGKTESGGFVETNVRQFFESDDTVGVVASFPVTKT